MKKVLQWIGIVLGAAVGYIMVRYGLPLLMVILLFTGISMEDEALNNSAEQALTELQLTQIVQHATSRDLTIEGVMTVFPVYQYDYVDNDVHAALMAHLATAEGWQTGTMASNIFSQQLADLHPGAAFLLPEDKITFDAWYTGADTLACFDRDSSLFFHLSKGATPSPGEIKTDGLTVPHNGYLYELETHSGFFGDGETYRACIVPDDARPALEAALAAHSDWQEGIITREEYIHLHTYEFWAVPHLFPAEAVTFDWWCYVDTYARAHPDFESEYTPDNSDFPAVMRQAGARPGSNWLVALYDADTGLFIYYQYDS